MVSPKAIQRIVLESVDAKKFTVSWLEGDIIEIRIKEGEFLDVDDIKELQVHKAKLTKNRKHCVFFITPQFGNLSKEARVYSASDEASLNAVAKAIYTPNLGMKILANFFISVNKPTIPHKIFSDADAAFRWMKLQLKTLR